LRTGDEVELTGLGGPAKLPVLRCPQLEVFNRPPRLQVALVAYFAAG
jgi:hypothetical protein